MGEKLLSLGRAVESHTVTHLHTEEPGWQSVDWEYQESQKQIAVGMKDRKRHIWHL